MLYGIKAFDMAVNITVKSVYNDHPWDPKIVAIVGR